MIPIILDRERRIAFTNLARYRVESLERTFSLRDLSNRRKAYGALICWIWGCLVPEDAEDFQKPEDLAEYVTAERTGEFIKALSAALAEASETSKKKPGMTPKPSPSLNSD